MENIIYQPYQIEDKKNSRKRNSITFYKKKYFENTIMLNNPIIIIGSTKFQKYCGTGAILRNGNKSFQVTSYCNSEPKGYIKVGESKYIRLEERPLLYKKLLILFLFILVLIQCILYLESNIQVINNPLFQPTISQTEIETLFQDKRDIPLFLPYLSEGRIKDNHLNIKIGNNISNKFDCYFEIIADGELIYKSNLLRPGKYINQIILNQPIKNLDDVYIRFIILQNKTSIGLLHYYPKISK